jgi:hypothetical protein
MNPDGAEPDAVGADEAGLSESVKGDLMLKQEIPSSLEGEPETPFLVGGEFVRCFHVRSFVAGSRNFPVYTLKVIDATK